jgi:hypothetical protein
LLFTKKFGDTPIKLANCGKETDSSNAFDWTDTDVPAETKDGKAATVRLALEVIVSDAPTTRSSGKETTCTLEDETVSEPTITASWGRVTLTMAETPKESDETL